jgi:hypothetical protein
MKTSSGQWARIQHKKRLAAEAEAKRLAALDESINAAIESVEDKIQETAERMQSQAAQSGPTPPTSPNEAIHTIPERLRAVSMDVFFSENDDSGNDVQGIEETMILA